METVEKTRDEVRAAVRQIMSWDFSDGGHVLLEQVTEAIVKGESVLIDALSYRGNGHYDKPRTKDRYRYKMIVPIMCRRGDLYSTDLFSDDQKYAINGRYGIYSFTRQLVYKVLKSVPTDYRDMRFEFGYRKKDDDSPQYGQFKIVMNKNT